MSEEEGPECRQAASDAVVNGQVPRRPGVRRPVDEAMPGDVVARVELPEAKMREYRTANNLPEPEPRQPGEGQRARGGPSARDAAWIAAFKGGPASYGDFTLAGPISDAVNLAAISLRLGGRRLLWDSASAKVTNVPEANAFLTREYRAGWTI